MSERKKFVKSTISWEAKILGASKKGTDFKVTSPSFLRSSGLYSVGMSVKELTACCYHNPKFSPSYFDFNLANQFFRLVSKASNESLNTIKMEGVKVKVEPGGANNAETTLFETRRRLEAFR